MYAFTRGAEFEQVAKHLGTMLVSSPEVDVGTWHAMDVAGDPTKVSREVMNVTIETDVCPSIQQWQQKIRPNLPWAEDHFKERVSGYPMNPAPSEEWWPYAVKSNIAHKKNEIYSHTYPERYWPKHAGQFVPDMSEHWGIRFAYGDLSDVVDSLRKQPETRQAYLPVFFPEDTGMPARLGERIPCSLGYHFLMRHGKMHCVYYMRSCDYMRYLRDDVYMAGRLLQWVWDQAGVGKVVPGTLTTHIASLHIFNGDVPRLRDMLK